jgi:hypothetical protein
MRRAACTRHLPRALLSRSASAIQADWTTPEALMVSIRVARRPSTRSFGSSLTARVTQAP